MVVHARGFGTRSAVVVLLAVAALTLAAAIPTPVRADSFGTGTLGAGWLADNSAHSYCKTASLDADLHSLLDDVMTHSLGNSTDMTVHPETCQLQTDAWVYDADLPGVARGAYTCNSGQLIGNVCSSASVTVDPAQIRIGDFDADDFKKTFCHEIGHSVGLAHASNHTDCMRNGEIPAPIGQWKHYNAHHDGHINAQY